MKKFLHQSLLLLFGLFSAFAVNAQQVKGTVIDRGGNTLAGVTVSIVGTTTGVTTDGKGNYSINVGDQRAATLLFSYIGHEPLEAKVNNRTEINITLSENSTLLDAVVAIGYGTSKRSDVVGSISSISAETLSAVPVASVVEAMTGRMAGVHITSSEGSPDAEMKIRVRGGTSITQDNSPLYIIDGFTASSINDVAASDIESIDVLKDAFSTAIYGSRGANGVVIVTTKSGKAGKVVVNYNMYAGFKKIAKKLNVLNPSEYVKYQYELASNRDKVSDTYNPYFGMFQDIDLYNNVNGTDWQEQAFGETGSVFNHNLSLRGGGEKYSWAASYAHIYDGSIMVGSNFKRDNFNFKANFKPVNKISLDFSVRYSDADYRGSGANANDDKGSTSGGRLKHTLLYAPIPMMKVAEGSDEEEEYGDSVNPLTAIRDNDSRRNRTEWNANAAITWEIIKALKLKVDIGMRDYDQEEDRFYGLSTYYVKNSAYPKNPSTINTNTISKRLSNTNTLNYDFKNLINNKKHSLSWLIGEEYQITKSNTKSMEANGLLEFFSPSQAWNLIGLNEYSSINNIFNYDDKLLSFFTRANYEYNKKYSASATFRADGSSKFARAYQWGYFPSAAAAWRVSEEPWMEGSKSWLSNLKIRYSFGTSGNDKIKSGLNRRTFVIKNTTNISLGESYLWAGDIKSNENLKWETTLSQNIGIDYGFWRNRISGSIELYNNKTKDLLVNLPMQGTGYVSKMRNVAETRNRGVEFSVNAVLIDKEKYGLNFNFNIAFNKNKVLSLGELNNISSDSQWSSSEIGTDFMVVEGRPLGEMYGYVTDGRYEVSDFKGYNATTKKWELIPGVADNSGVIGAENMRPGGLKLKNLDPQNSNVVNGDDRKIIGNANPIHTGGFSLSGYAYGFDMTANFNWSYGNDIYNANKLDLTASRKYDYRNMLTIMKSGKRWNNIDWETGEFVNDAAQLAAMNENTTMWSPNMKQSVFHSWAVEDGSFLRLSTLTIGYTLPAKITKKARIEKLRFYATGSNLFCWTNYSGFDPEVDTRRKTPLTPGVDYSGFPRSRQYVFGINITF